MVLLTCKTTTYCLSSVMYSFVRVNSNGMFLKKQAIYSRIASTKKEILKQPTSLKKSPCFLSSASIARSKIPPVVALDNSKNDYIKTIH